MPTRFHSIPFSEPDRAQDNWAHLERTAPSEITHALISLLRSSPDPDSALNYFERFNCNASPKTIQYLTRHPAAMNVLVPLFSQSHFLSETLLLHPEYVEWLHRDRRIEFLKSKEDLLEELSRFEATLGEMGLAERLARFKRREYLRIVLRDVTKIATLAETTWELSTLADVLLEKTLRLCDQQLRNRYGVPQYFDDSGKVTLADFVVIALGKLGGNELNYSSDIDLLYLYSHDGETEGAESKSGTRISNQEYFIKLSSAVTEAVSRVTPAGWSFRVDLRLRPQGREGFLSRSLRSALEYYGNTAESWELQALLKARPVAGNLMLGKRFLQGLQSRIYPSEEKKRIIESIEGMRSKIDAKLERAETAGFNIKLSRGTIRDIEFITQCLQRIHGAQDAWVREGNTLFALRRLHDNNYLARPEFVSLASAYEFFRIIEHRLQLDRGLQTHTLPDQLPDQQLLALRMGFENSPVTTARDSLLHAIDYHRTTVLRIYQHILEERSGMPLGFLETPSTLEVTESAIIPPVSGTFESLVSALSKIHPEFSDAVKQVDLDVVSKIPFLSFLERLIGHPPFLTHFKMISNGSARLKAIFSSGIVLTAASVRHPEWVLLNLSSSTLETSEKGGNKGVQGKRGKRRRTLRRTVKPLLPERGKHKTNVNSIRDENRRRAFDILAAESMGGWPLSKIFEQLSVNAETTISSSLSLAISQLRHRWSHASSILKNPHFHFGIFGLGRIATRELDIGSDLDMLFIADYSYFKVREAAREMASRLAETVISILTSYTREGPLYLVDLRLRPSGKEGELVQDASSLIDYFRGRAQVWEHTAYLKLRPLAGDLDWARNFHRALKKTSFQAVSNRPLKADLLEIRTRLEQAAASSDASFDFKQGAGGIYDIDFTLAFCHFRNGKQYRVGSTTIEALDSAKRNRLLPDNAAAIFRRAMSFYRSLDHAIRLVKGKPVRSIDQKLIEEIPIHILQRMARIGPHLSSDPLTAFLNPAGVMSDTAQTAAEVRQAMMRLFED